MPSLNKRNMKCGIHWNWGLGLVIAALPFVGASPQEAFSQPRNAAPIEPAPAAAENPVASPAPGETATDADVVDAPAKPISNAKPLPQAVRLTGPAAEVLRLADSGVEESVMLAFVANSTSTFNLGAEEIIYLNDMGLPSAVVTAMIQRDEALKASFANTGPAPEPLPAPAPADMAPQPDNTTGTYVPPPDSAYGTFYDPLAPYGTWLDVAGYGPCWQPSVVMVNPGWQPYCDGGRWIYTDCGWYWMSGYSWGWAPFHYGRWFRHRHYGWCWMPGNTWGPAWVCWRHGGNYCGWAPLPPAAVYHPTVGLTFHGQRVSSSFAFGLGATSYTFVHTSHFPDRQLNRQSLSHQQAAQVFNQTVPSTTIVGSGSRIINHGIPVSQVATASRTSIHVVAIREMNSAGVHSVRGERLEPGSRTLSVFRPQFSQPAAAQPVSAGRPRSDLHQNGGSPWVVPTPSAPQLTPMQSPRAPGTSPVTQPAGGGSSGGRSNRSANSASAVPGAPGGGATTSSHNASDPAPRLGQPIILRRPASTPQLSQSPPTTPAKDSLSRPELSQPRHSFIIAEAETRKPAQPRFSTSRAVEPTPRNEQPWRPAAPTYSRPVETPRNAPAPPHTEPRAESYSRPTPSPAPRSESVVSQPAHSAPSGPSVSRSAPSSSPSSGRGGR